TKHRAWVHHNAVVAKHLLASLRQPVASGVFAMGWEEASVHALLLNAEHHHGISIADLVFHAVGNTHRPGLDAKRQQRRWRDEHDLGAELAQQIGVRASDARMQNIANDDDLAPLNSTEALTQRHCV